MDYDEPEIDAWSDASERASRNIKGMLNRRAAKKKWNRRPQRSQRFLATDRLPGQRQSSYLLRGQQFIFFANFAPFCANSSSRASVAYSAVLQDNLLAAWRCRIPNRIISLPVSFYPSNTPQEFLILGKSSNGRRQAISPPQPVCDPVANGIDFSAGARQPHRVA
jgi:hypothetical protein